MTQPNTTEWNPSNEYLAELTGLPNLDTITDTARLINLAYIADSKLAGMQRQGGSPLRYLAAAKLYADRADDKAGE